MILYLHEFLDVYESLASSDFPFVLTNTVTENDNVSNPKLWSSIKSRITRGSKGGNAGDWSARKAQLAVSEYKKAGGKYKKGKSKKDTGLYKWQNQKWVAIAPKKESEEPMEVLAFITPEYEMYYNYETEEYVVQETAAGDIIGPCGTRMKDGKILRCLPESKAKNLSKEERAKTARAKTRGKGQFISNTFTKESFGIGCDYFKLD